MERVNVSQHWSFFLEQGVKENIWVSVETVNRWLGKNFTPRRFIIGASFLHPVLT
jgi:hypothetical protein